MDQDSPFASFGKPDAITPTRVVYVMFCVICHYVWKAPGVATACVNCKNPDIPIELVHYDTEVPIT